MSQVFQFLMINIVILWGQKNVLSFYNLYVSRHQEHPPPKKKYVHF